MPFLDIKPQINDVISRIFLRYHDKEISKYSPGIEFNNLKQHDKLEPFSTYITRGLDQIQELVYRKSLKGALWTVNELCCNNKYVTVCKPKYTSKYIYYKYSISLENWKYHFEFFVPERLISYNLFINKDRIIKGWVANTVEEGDIISNFFKDISKHMFHEGNHNFLLNGDKIKKVEISWKKRKHIKIYNYTLL